MTLPTDSNVLTFIATQNTLRGEQLTNRLVHMAEGLPGSMSTGGRRHTETEYRLRILNLTGLIYAAQQGWIAAADVDLGDAPFGGVLNLDWEIR